jgi:uncharacterized delta-60 repeat protein
LFHIKTSQTISLSKILVLVFLLVPLVVMISTYPVFAAGTLDPSFGINGAAEGSGLAFVLQPNGKIVAIDRAGNSSDYDFAVMRFNSDGSPDNSFGTNGSVITSVTPFSDIATCVAIQTDGRIVVGGYTSSIEGIYLTLARYNVDGSLDNSFGNGGIVLSAGTGAYDLNALAIQTDGKIVVAGSGGRARGSECFSSLMLGRYTSDGVLDRSFGILNGRNGIVLTPLGSGPNCMSHVNLRALLLTPDGRILVGGGAYHNVSGQFVF